MEARLSSPTDIVGFRSEAQALLAQQVPPEAVEWRAPTPDAMRGRYRREQVVVPQSATLLIVDWKRILERSTWR